MVEVVSEVRSIREQAREWIERARREGKTPTLVEDCGRMLLHLEIDTAASLPPAELVPIIKELLAEG